MQSYLGYGYGFHGGLLTKEQYRDIIENEDHPKKNNCGIYFQSYYEDPEGKDHGTVILCNLGDARHDAKMEDDLAGKLAKFGAIPDEKRAEIDEILHKRGLSHLRNEVKLVMYMSHS